MIGRSATANFADASINMLPNPLPALPAGWMYGQGAACGGGRYAIIPDPDHVGERAPAPPGAIQQ